MRMQKDNHFVEIRPRGSQRQYTLEKRKILADDMSCASVEQEDAVNDARTAFAAACGLPQHAVCRTADPTKFIGCWDIRWPSSTAMRKILRT